MKIRYCVVCLVLLASSAPAFAQVDAAIATVKQHFVQNEARYGASAEDLAELIVTDAYTSRRTNATYVYLRQAYHGIEVYNATAQAVVTSDNEIMAPHARFVLDLADKVNTETASLPLEAAAARAARHLSNVISRPDARPVLSDDPGETLPSSSYPASDFLPVTDDARLVYAVLDDQRVRLVWEIMVDSKHGHMWFTYVDAISGTVHDVISLTAEDHWGSAAYSGSSSRDNLFVADKSSIPEASHVASGTYNVFALPAESPIHGPQIMAVMPHDATASSLGWHDTGTNSYTITRGNNVFAFEDRNNTGSGFSPDGGGSLLFDFPFDSNEQPVDYQDLAVTNLFYWNNITHDVMYQYGFDEAAGNFQINNFGNGGNGNDAVNALAQSRADLDPCPAGLICMDNAQFSTPPDGSPGTMRMFEWSPGSSSFTINAPPDIAGPYAHGVQVASAGPPPTPDWGDTDGFNVTGDLVLVEGAGGSPLGCEDLTNPGEIAGNIALIERGVCSFLHKVYFAQQAGAIAAVIHNCQPGLPDCSTNLPGENILNMSADDTDPFFDLTTIAAMFVIQSVGEAMRDNLPGVVVTLVEEQGTIFRDSDLDSGIIVHEYGHGISNRLTGGPGNVGCLNSATLAEQPGEGWSDFYGLMLTQEVGDTATEPRGVGTYVEFQPANGFGIRPTPYSTNFGINPATYGDTVPLVIGQQHTVGYIWATALWEMTWDLINAHGFDPDIYDATGTAGNQIALSLVTEGMKLQPCSPGFVDARDAILRADTLLYVGAYSEQLWPAFARRGLGLFAEQGSSTTNSDNVADFTDPTAVSIEDLGDGLPESYRLSQAYPNPFNPQAQFTLHVGQTQDVRIEVFDILGRQVALLHDGQLASGTTHPFAIDGANLASGVYMYRVVGEHFMSARQVTLLK